MLLFQILVDLPMQYGKHYFHHLKPVELVLVEVWKRQVVFPTANIKDSS